jgi:hypothetical protein
MEAVKGCGERLFRAVFTDDVYASFLRSRDTALEEEKGLRVRLRIDVPEFHDYPWEFLYNAHLNQFLALSTDTPVVRYMELPYPVQPLIVQPPLKILVMISSPEGFPQLNVEEEWRRLSNALAPLLRRGLVTLERLKNPTLSALQQYLRRGEYHIFHFVGHGKFSEHKQDGMLLLEDENGGGRPISGQYLGTILHDHRSLRLVVLNACEGARTSREDPYAGVAQTLVLQGIPAVIAMQFEIVETAAITFAQEFYGAVADGFPVDAAVSEARKAIFARGNDVEWGTPVLYMRTPQGVIFEIPEAQRVKHTLAEEPIPDVDKETERQNKLAAMYAEAVRLVQEERYQDALEKWREIRSTDSRYPDWQKVERTARKRLAALAKPGATILKALWIGLGGIAAIAIAALALILFTNGGDKIAPPTKLVPTSASSGKIVVPTSTRIPVKTSTPRPPTATQIITDVPDPTIYDGFDDNRLNTNFWDESEAGEGSSLGRAYVKDGLLNLVVDGYKHKVVVTANQTYSPRDGFIFIEARMMLDPNTTRDGTDSGVGIGTGVGYSKCSIFANQGTQTISCWSYYFDAQRGSYYVEINPGTWHVLRIEIDPEPMTFAYIIDGIKIGAYSPGESEQLRGLEYSFSLDLNNWGEFAQNPLSYVDYATSGFMK